MQLYGYFRSSASYRVRIALNLKHVRYDTIPIHLVGDGGQQNTAEFAQLNPQRLVPVLIDGANGLIQSLSIIEYLEEVHPAPPLLPASVADRARVRALAQIVASEIHPVNNLSVLRYLSDVLGVTDEDKIQWYRYWVNRGLEALEILLRDEPRTGTFCHGETPGLADCCLIPQLYNARRFGCELASFPTLVRIDAACLSMNAFIDASPDRQ